LKALVAYYSRTGTTKKIAEDVSQLLKCDMESIVDKKNRAGIIGYLCAGRDASTKKLTEIEQAKFDPASYDLVIVGTPVWASTLSAPVRTYLTQHRERFNKMAFFCTCDGGKGTAFEEMEMASGKKPLAVLELTKREISNGQCLQKTKDFAGSLSRLMEVPCS